MQYVGVGHFVECHEYGSEDGVHGHRYATCDEHFATTAAGPSLPGRFSMPSEARKTGTPEANIVMAMLMPIPRMPHTSARGAMPKPGRL